MIGVNRDKWNVRRWIVDRAGEREARIDHGNNLAAQFPLRNRSRDSMMTQDSCQQKLFHTADKRNPATEEAPKPSAAFRIVLCFSISPIWMAHASQAITRDQDLDRTAAHRDEPYPKHYRRDMRSFANDGFRYNACDRH